MMKSRTFFIIAISLFILGVALFTFFNRDQESSQAFPASVTRDCAPWDGAAFTVRVPMEAGKVISISIWQEPDIKFPVTFSFPDNTGQIGNAYQRSTPDEYGQLSGKVSFSRVNRENPIEGEFELTNEKGEKFIGKFIAEWDDQVVMCG